MNEIMVGHGENIENPTRILQNSINELKNWLNEGGTESEITMRNLENLGFILARKLKGRIVAPRVVMVKLSEMGINPIDLAVVSSWSRSPGSYVSEKLLPPFSTPKILKMSANEFLAYASRISSGFEAMATSTNSKEIKLLGLCFESRVISCLASHNTSSAVFLNLRKFESNFDRWIDEVVGSEISAKKFHLGRGMLAILNFKNCPQHLMNKQLAKRLIDISLERIIFKAGSELDYNSIAEALDLDKLYECGHFTLDDCFEISLKYASSNIKELSIQAGNFWFKYKLNFLQNSKSIGLDEPTIKSRLKATIIKLFSIDNNFNYEQSLKSSIEIFDHNYKSASTSELEKYFTNDVMEALSVSYDAFEHYVGSNLISDKLIINDKIAFTSYSKENIAERGMESYVKLIEASLEPLFLEIASLQGYKYEAPIYARKESLDLLKETGSIRVFGRYSEKSDSWFYDVTITNRVRQKDDDNHDLEMG